MHKLIIFLLTFSFPLFCQEIRYIPDHKKFDESERYAFPVDLFANTSLLKSKVTWGDFYVSYDDKKNKVVKHKGFYLALKNPQTELELKTYTTVKSTFDLLSEAIDSQGATLAGRVPLTPVDMDLKLTSNLKRDKGGVEVTLKVKF